MKTTLCIGIVTLVIILTAAGPCLAIFTPGSITVEKYTTVPTDALFDFFWDYGSFSLGDGEHITFNNLPPDQYTVGEVVPSGWQLYEIAPSFLPTVVNPVVPSLTFNLPGGEDVRITFVNRPAVPVPSAALLSGVGALLMGWLRRREAL